MWLSFTRPEYLLILPVALWLLWKLARVSYADLRGRRRTVAWALRIAIAVSLVLALAGAQFVTQGRDSVVVFAVDMSQSIPESERARALAFVKESLKSRGSNDRAALVLFGREAAVESENLLKPEQVQTASTPGGTHTDIASALRLSLGLLSPEAAGRVVLLSDGNENVGSAVEEVLLAQASKVPVEVVPLRTRAARDVLVKDVSVPAEARRDEPFPLRATLEATQPTNARVTVLADDRPLLRRDMALAAGRSTIRLPVALPESGFTRLDVLVESAEEASRENNRGTAFVRVKSKPRVLIVSQDPSDVRDLARGLEAQDIVVESGGPARLPTNVADLDKYDSVILNNFPAYRMTDRQMAMLRDATRDLGVGLGMIGGEFSFGAGGYYRTPVEEALPVTMDLKKDRAFPAASMLIIVDTSGSMGMVEDGVQKIQLAAESACTAVDLLQPYDSVGVMASDPQPTLVAEMRRVQNRNRIKNDVRSLRAGGGGIYCFPSLSLGYDIMKRERSPVRHVIMLADGSDCDEPAGCVALAAEMAAHKITVSTIAFGDGPDVPFLKDVAKAGKGNFYLTEKAKDLQKVFTRETLTIAKSVLVEEQFYPRLKETTDMIEGVNFNPTPPLLGYVATSAKSLAHVPLATHKDDPLLAHWQCGLGKAVAFTSDAKPKWAAHWLAWPEFTRFWSQAIRWSLRQETSGVLRPQVESAGDRARVTVEAASETGAYLDGLEIKAHVNQPDGGRSEVPLTQTGPGRYEAVVPAPATGSYVIGLEASGPGGFQAQQTFGFSVPYPPDLADTRENEPFLKALAEQTGGRVLANPADAFTPPAHLPRLPVDIWRFLLWVAALLLPLDVAVRRLIITREDVAPFVALWVAARARLGARFVPRRFERATTGQLLARKRAVREGITRPGEEVPLAPPPSVSPPAAPAAIPPAPPGAETPAPQQQPRPSPTATATPEPKDGGDTTSRLLRKKRERKGE